jgi:dTDP-4-dehydrorhamnose reductase
MRVFLTGASGFVGSNVARVFTEGHGAQLIRPGEELVDLTGADAVARSFLATRPEVVVHAAIWNDFTGIYADRPRAWDAYVGATRNVVDTANAVGAHVVLVSTDWVFDGTQSGATEDTPPNPVNLYGFLKAASEMVVRDRADSGAVARLSGVNGVHLEQPSARRVQDAGFGHFVASVVDALGAGEPFTVWESDDINTIATPTLASEAGELLWRLAERRLSGVFHCCGGETIDRVGLARRTAEAFDLDGDLLAVGPPPPDALPPAKVPYDTSLDARATAAALDAELPDVDTMLARLRSQMETRRSAA